MATSTLGSGTLVLAGSTSGTTTVTATAVAGTTTLTLPAATDTLVGKATTDTLTNKTLTTPSVSSPTISDGTANGVPYLNGSKVLTTGSALVFDGTNLGIGTTSITSGSGFTPRLVLADASAPALIVKGPTSQEASVGAANGMFIDCLGSTTGTNNNIIFRNTSTNSSFTPIERARIDSSGNLLVGTTSGSTHQIDKSIENDYALNIRNTASANNFGVAVRYPNSSPNTASNQFLICSDSSANRIILYSNGGIANYTANNSPLSDRRLKKDITPAGSYLEKICAIPVVNYFFKDQTDDLVNLGVIAQDVLAVAPELCNEEGWGTKAEDGTTYLGIWETDIQYALMKCIQEQQALITTLTDRITALENK